MPLSQRLSRAAWTLLLDQALDGLRHGGMQPWPTGRWPRLKSRLEQQWLGPIWGTWGDHANDDDRWPKAAQLLLRWACGLIRPDHRSSEGLAQISEAAWVEQTTWRPLLAVAATSNLLQVPDLTRHYRRNSGDSAVDTLSGLWAVGASTTYRYVEKGKRLLVDALLSAQSDARQRWQLRGVAAMARYASMSTTWHQTQAHSLWRHGHAMDAAWHFCECKLWLQLASLLQRKALELASNPEHEALCQTLRRAAPDAVSKVALSLGEGALWRCLGETEKELDCLRLALRLSEIVQGPAQRLCIGQALYALGYFYASRDPDQAIGHLDAAIQHLSVASQNVSAEEFKTVQSQYISSLALLAFINFRKNSTQGHALLRSALAAKNEFPHIEADTLGVLLKAQAEEARCRDQFPQAIHFLQEALVLYEQISDSKEIVGVYNNLGQLLAVAGRPEEARTYCKRVLNMARSFSIRPETLLGAHGGLALVAMSCREFDSALNHLKEVLEISSRNNLVMHNVTALLNIAETYFLKFNDSGSPEDAHLGDQYVEQSRMLANKLGLSQLESKAQSLKQATLNPQTAVHHLLPVETSAHPGEFAKIEALRAELALPRPPAQRARTHIALSQLYLRIAAKERDAARGLMQTHGLGELEAEVEALQQTWTHDGNLASQVSSRWREQVGDWLTDSQRKAVLERLLAEGSLSKSSYGEAAEVSPATASKHLGLLADKGLLEQHGRGPATRYVLPDEAASATTASRTASSGGHGGGEGPQGSGLLSSPGGPAGSGSSGPQGSSGTVH